MSTPHKGGHEYRDLVAEATISEFLPPEMDDEFRKLTKQFVANAIDGRQSLRQERLEKAIQRILDFFAVRPLYEEYKTGRIPDARIRSDLFEIDPIHARAAFLAYACNDKRLEYGLVGMPDYQLFSFYDRFLSAQSTTQHSKEKRKMRRVVTDSFKGVGNGWSPSKGELKSIHGYMKDHSAKFSGFEWNCVAPEYYRPVHVYGNDFGRRAAAWITRHTGGGQVQANWDLNDSNRRVEIKFEKATSGYQVAKSESSQFTLDVSHLSRSSGSRAQNAPPSNASRVDGVYQGKSIEDYAPSLKREELTTRIPFRETTVPYRYPESYRFEESESRSSEKSSAFWRQYLESSPQFPVFEDQAQVEPTPKTYTVTEHAKLAYKAAKGERGADVQAWQAHNRKVTPELSSVVDGIHSKTIPPSEVVTSFVEGVVEGVVETGTFIGEEAIRVYHDEPTITAEIGRKIVRFAESEIQSASHGEKTETQKAIEGAAEFLGEDFERIRNGEQSKIVSSVKSYVDETPTQDILRGIGKEIGFGAATGTIAKAGGKALNKANALKQAPVHLNAWEKFKTEHVRSTGARELSIYDITKSEELAESIYSQIRANTNDVSAIARNTGLQESRIQRVKEHLFFKEHELRNSISRFDADPLIVESWKRLESGKFTNKDIQLLNHELFESKFEGIFKTDYLTSHNAANRAGYVSPAEGLDVEQLAEIYRGFLHRFG